MTEPPIPLTALSEAQRAPATQRLTINRSALEDGVTQKLQSLIVEMFALHLVRDAGMGQCFRQ